MNNSGDGGGSEMRTGRDNYEVPKCYDNIVKTPTELNSPLNRCVPQFRDEDMIECQFSAFGCNFRATDRSQLIFHNEENIHRHMNVSRKCGKLNTKNVQFYVMFFFAFAPLVF